MLRERKDNSYDYQRHENGQKDFDPALRILAGDCSGISVNHHLERAGAVVVAEQPNRNENVFESLAGIIGIHL